MGEIRKVGRMGWTGWMDEMDGMHWMVGRMAAMGGMGWIMKFNHDGRPLQYTQTLTMKLTSEAIKFGRESLYIP